MWGKLLTVLVVTSIIGAVTFLGWRVVVAYGDARYAAGKAQAEVDQVPAILAANERAARATIDGRDRVILASETNAAELRRLLPLLLSSQSKVDAYAQTDAGRLACLGPDRVLGITADRTALFSFTPAAVAGAAAAGPVPADLLTGAAGWQHEQR